MTETVKLRLERGPAENTINAVVAIISTAMLYYSLHPTVAERHAEMVTSYWNRIVHRVSVSQAIAAIRSLPETPENL